MHALRELGVRVALTTSHRLLALLPKRLPLDQLKIDRSFVQQMLGDRQTTPSSRA